MADVEQRTGRVPLWALATAVLVAVGLALAALAVLGGRSLPERTGPPIEQLAVERTVLTPGTIALTVRNTGPDEVTVAQAFVNDVYVDVSGGDDAIGRFGTATLELDYAWQDGQPYLVSLLTSTGLVLEHEIPAAVRTPETSGSLLGLMALLGTYVGVVPVLLGMVLLPLLRRAGRTLIQVLLAVTAGLLAFLALDGALEGVELAAAADGAFGGAALVALGAALAFLVLSAVDSWLRARRGTTEAAGFRLALLIAIGIGLHNLGEGLAIGSAYAIGELALGAALVVGFALHNTTEGVAIVAPLTGEPARLPRLLLLGIIAGVPAIVGAVVGVTVNNVELSAFLLGVGVGAIAQVIVQITPALRRRDGSGMSPAVYGGVLGGVLVMYLTGLLVTA